VVVANTQVRNLRTEVEKGFIWTVIGYELAGPKIIWEIMIKRFNMFFEKKITTILNIIKRELG